MFARFWRSRLIIQLHDFVDTQNAAKWHWNLKVCANTTKSGSTFEKKRHIISVSKCCQKCSTFGQILPNLGPQWQRQGESTHPTRTNHYSLTQPPSPRLLVVRSTCTSAVAHAQLIIGHTLFCYFVCDGAHQAAQIAEQLRKYFICSGSSRRSTTTRTSIMLSLLPNSFFLAFGIFVKNGASSLVQ